MVLPSVEQDTMLLWKGTGRQCHYHTVCSPVAKLQAAFRAHAKQTTSWKTVCKQLCVE